MKLKEQKKLGMLYFVLGAVLAIAGYFKKAVGLHRLAAAFACLGLSVCCAQPGSAVIPNRRLIMMLRFRTSEQHMLQIRRAV